MSSEEKTGFFSREISPAALKIIIIILFVLVFLSLGLNWYLISEVLRVRQQAIQAMQDINPVVQDALLRADTELEAFQNSTLKFTVNIDQELPVDVEIPINKRIEVPINVIVPIKEQIQTTVMMDPFQAGLEIPVDIDVPVDVEVPIDVVLPVEINETIPISTTVPVKVDVPIAVDVSDTDLVPYIKQLRQVIARFSESLDQMISTIEE